ncbi:MAG: GNAT family N-acetyltransferase, partial [Geminicoccaceae bacterium]
MADNLIREAIVEDAASIARVHIASWREAYTGIMPVVVLEGFDLAKRTRRWQHILAEDEPDKKTLVLEVGGDVVGFAGAGPQREAGLMRAGYFGEFFALYLLQSFHGQGLGRLMMDAMAVHLSTRGFAAAAVWVLEDNHRARGFYEALGGELLGVREAEITSGV